LAKSGSKAHVFAGRILSVNTDGNTLSLYIAKNQRTYTVDYSSSRLLRGSGGGLQEAELNIGDTAKIKGIAVDAQITAKKLTDLSVRNVKIEGVIGEVSDTEDAFILETKKGDITVNIEDNTDILHKKCREANNPLTKALVRGLFNSNTKEIYKTRSIVMHSL